MATRGRPKLAAQTLDEALAREYSGQSPKRARNAFERQAMAKRRGRKVNPNSPSRVAAQYAAYLVGNKALSQRAACKLAAKEYGLSFESIRSLVRELVSGKTVRITRTRRTWAGTLKDEAKLPFVANIETLS